MEFEMINKNWKRSNDLIAENISLTQKIIINSIKNQSGDVLNRFRKELLLGVFGGFIVSIFLIYAAIQNSQGIIYSLVGIIGVIMTIYIIIDVLSVYYRISSFNPGKGSLKECIEGKLSILRSFYLRNKYLQVIYAIAIYIIGLTSYLSVFSNDAILTLKDLMVYSVIGIMMIIGLLIISRIKRHTYISDLESCLVNLEGVEPVSTKQPGLNISSWIVVLLLIIAVGIAVYSIII